MSHFARPVRAVTIVCMLYPSLLSLAATVVSGNNQGSNDRSSEPSLEYALRAGPKPIALDSEADSAGPKKYRLPFVLIVKNTGTSEFRGGAPSSKICDIAIYPSDQSADKPVWLWSTDKAFSPVPTPIEIGPNKTWEVNEVWEFSFSDVQEGSYRVEATFIPTGQKRSVTFQLSKPSEAEILFTGRLMGYYRLPNRQSFAPPPEKPCLPPGSGDDAPSPDAKIFQEYINEFRTRHANFILVGTGDNFAPNYYSRAFSGVPNRRGRPMPAGKELYTWDALQNKWIWYEDVVAGTRVFARRSRYDPHRQRCVFFVLRSLRCDCSRKA